MDTKNPSFNNNNNTTTMSAKQLIEAVLKFNPSLNINPTINQSKDIDMKDNNKEKIVSKEKSTSKSKDSDTCSSMDEDDKKSSSKKKDDKKKSSTKESKKKDDKKKKKYEDSTDESSEEVTKKKKKKNDTKIEEEEEDKKSLKRKNDQHQSIEKPSSSSSSTTPNKSTSTNNIIKKDVNNNTNNDTSTKKQKVDNNNNNNGSTNNKTKKHYEAEFTKNMKGWDGESPLSSLTLGELMTSLLKGNYRVEVAEYVLDAKVSGLVDKYQFLLEWAFNTLSSSYIGQCKSKRGVVVTGTPFCFDIRLWRILDSVLSKKEFSCNVDATNSIILSKDNLFFMLDIVANAYRNFGDNDGKLNGVGGSVPPVPPLDILPFILKVLNASVHLYLTADIHREIPVFVDKLVPALSTFMLTSTQSAQGMEYILQVSYTALEQLLQLIRVGKSARPLFNTILSILSNLSIFQHSSINYRNNLLTNNNNNNNNNTSTTSIIEAIDQNIQVIDNLIRWSFFHPDSKWEHQAYLINSNNSTITSSSTTNINKEKDQNSKDKKKDVVDERLKTKDQQTINDLVFEKIESIVQQKVDNSTSYSAPLIMLGWLERLLSIFVSQYKQVGRSQIPAAILKECKISVEFAFFKRLYGVFDKAAKHMSSHPNYYSAMSSLLDRVSSINIVHQDNPEEFNFLKQHVVDTVTLLETLSSKSSSSGNDHINGLYLLLLSYTKLSHRLTEPSLEKIIGFIISQKSSPIENSILMIKTLLDVYLSIRQSDKLIQSINNQIINGRLRYVSVEVMSNRGLMETLGRHISNTPFGLVPIILEQTMSVWRDYFIFQLEEESDIRDPILVPRLQCFAIMFSSILNNIEMTSFVIQNLQRFLPSTYTSIIDPLLNLQSKLVSKLKDEKEKKDKKDKKDKMAIDKQQTSDDDQLILSSLLSMYYSFSQVHSYVNRQVIVVEGEGLNDHHYHPQQFKYFRLYEIQLNMGQVMKFLLGNQDVCSIANNLSTCQLYIARIQQLNSLLSSVSVTTFQRHQVDDIDIDITYVPSTLKNCAPVQVETELVLLINRLLGTMINLKDNNNQEAWKLILDNVCAWCDYASSNHIESILSNILTPPPPHHSTLTLTSSSTPTPFNLVLTNSQFYEIESFRHHLPIALAQRTRLVLENGQCSKKLLSIFDYIIEQLNEPNNNKKNKKIEKIGNKIVELTDSSLNLGKDVWSQLTWLMSIVPGINPLYLEQHCISTIIYIPIIVSLINGDDNDYNNTMFSTRKFIKHCLMMDVQEIVKQLPSELWNKLGNKQDSLLADSQLLAMDIQAKVYGELWEKTPESLVEIAKVALKSKDVSTLASVLCAVTQDAIDQPTDQSIPQSLSNIIDQCNKFVDQFIKELESTKDTATFLKEKTSYLLLSIFYSWYKGNIDESRKKTIGIIKHCALYISKEMKSNNMSVPVTLQYALVSLLSLYANVYVTISNDQDTFETSYVTSLLVYMMGAYPEQSNQYKRVSSAIVEIHRQVGQSMITALIDLLQTDQQVTIRLSVLKTINLILNTMSMTPINTTIQLNLVNSILVNILHHKQSLENESIVTLSLNILSKLMDMIGQLNNNNNNNVSIDNNLVGEIENTCLNSIMLTILSFDTPFIYSKNDRVTKHDDSSSSTTTEQQSSISRTPMYQLSPTNYHLLSNLTNSSYIAMCRLLSTVLRSNTKSTVHHIPAIINYTRYLVYSLADEDNLLNEQCARNLSRLLEMIGRMKSSTKQYAHYLLLDYFNILTYFKPDGGMGLKKQQHNQQDKVKEVTRYYLTIECRRVLQTGFVSLFSLMDSTTRDMVFNSLADQSKPHFKVLYESFTNEKHYSGK